MELLRKYWIEIIIGAGVVGAVAYFASTKPVKGAGGSSGAASPVAGDTGNQDQSGNASSQATLDDAADLASIFGALA